jgi:hypothetical protein
MKMVSLVLVWQGLLERLPGEASIKKKERNKDLNIEDKVEL